MGRWSLPSFLPPPRNGKRGKYVYQSSISRSVGNDPGDRNSIDCNRIFEAVEGRVAMTWDGLFLNFAIIGVGVALSMIMWVIKKFMCDEIEWPESWDRDECGTRR